MPWADGGRPDDMHPIEMQSPDKKKRDVYVYFDNDAKVRAPFDARSLATRLGVNPFS